MHDLLEGLNNPVDISWEKSNELWKGIFKIEDFDYEIIIKNYSEKEKHFLFKFTANRSFDMTNDVKKALTVIPTIEKAANDFIEEVKPDALIFTAADNSQGRKKFYTRFCESAKKRFKLNYHSEIKEHLMIFSLVTYSCDGTELALSITRILKDMG